MDTLALLGTAAGTPGLVSWDLGLVAVTVAGLLAAGLLWRLWLAARQMDAPLRPTAPASQRQTPAPAPEPAGSLADELAAAKEQTDHLLEVLSAMNDDTEVAVGRLATLRPSDPRYAGAAAQLADNDAMFALVAAEVHRLLEHQQHLTAQVRRAATG